MKKMKLIIDISDKMFDAFKKHGIMTFDNLDEYDRDMIADAISNGTPYNPSGDLISRSEILKHSQGGDYDGCGGFTKEYVSVKDIENAQAVPQVTVFTETADEKAVADLKAELQNVIDKRPSDQIAWEQGYEVGVAQGKCDRPKGEWKTVDGYDGDEYYECSNCGEPWFLSAGTPKDNNMNFCPNCGADMRGGAE